MKVWVLEKFVSPTETIKTLIDMIEMVESSRSSCSTEDSQNLTKALIVSKTRSKKILPDFGQALKERRITSNSAMLLKMRLNEIQIRSSELSKAKLTIKQQLGQTTDL